VCLEVIWLLQVLADKSVVVNLAVDSQRNAAILVGEGLSTAVYDLCKRASAYLLRIALTNTDNAQTLVSKD
jgi:hypothetical protein